MQTIHQHASTCAFVLEGPPKNVKLNSQVNACPQNKSAPTHEQPNRVEDVLPRAVELDLMTFKGPSQPEPFYDSLCKSNLKTKNFARMDTLLQRYE